MNNAVDFNIFEGVNIEEKINEMAEFIRFEVISKSYQPFTLNSLITVNGVVEANITYGDSEILDAAVGVDIYVNDKHIGYMDEAEEEVVAFHCLRNFMETGWDKDKFIKEAHTYSYGYLMDFEVDEVE